MKSEMEYSIIFTKCIMKKLIIVIVFCLTLLVGCKNSQESSMTEQSGDIDLSIYKNYLHRNINKNPVKKNKTS